ncbi:MAG TPA: thymidine phosphorylase [Acidobacteriota bacterium]
MRTLDFIRAKRDGEELSAAAIQEFVRNLVAGRVPDYQASAFLMAVYFQGMSEAETHALTEAMTTIGTDLDLKPASGTKIDKHSTGGVGDKTSLVIAPIVASAGILVPMISGRGLGHSGGTVDKLASIPGYRTDLSAKEFLAQLKAIGIVLAGQSADVAPADMKLYALRDATATVDCLPLIVSSILSKKIAAGLDGLVLDVKVGGGAFMKTLPRARALAEALVRTGTAMGSRVVALLTDMESPLGLAVGNALEVSEAVSVLKGQGPDDLREVCFELAAWMLVLGRVAKSLEIARARVEKQVQSGAAVSKLRQVIAHQGGNPGIVDEPGKLPRARLQRELRAKSAGTVQEVQAYPIGIAAVVLGAGRAAVEDKIDPGAGLLLRKKPGDKVEKNESLCVLYSDREASFAEAEALAMEAFVIGKAAPKKKKRILQTIEASHLKASKSGPKTKQKR